MRRAVTIRIPSRRTRVVAVDRKDAGRVLAHGQTTTSVLRKTRKAGAEDPVLLFVPDPKKRYIY